MTHQAALCISGATVNHPIRSSWLDHMSELVVYVPLDLKGVQTWLCSWAPGSRSPDMNLTLDQTRRGGARLLRRRPAVYEQGWKIQYLQRDPRTSLSFLRTAESQRPRNTSLTSIRSGQSQAASVMCRENVFTGYMTYGWRGILMGTPGYTILHKRGRTQESSLWFLGQFWSRPPPLECDRCKQASVLAADPSPSFPKQSLASRSREKCSRKLANGQNQPHK